MTRKRKTKADGEYTISLFIDRGTHQERLLFLGYAESHTIDGLPRFVFFTHNEQVVVEYEKRDPSRARLDIDYELNPPVVQDRFVRPRVVRWGGQTNPSNPFPHLDQVGNAISTHGPEPLTDEKAIQALNLLETRRGIRDRNQRISEINSGNARSETEHGRFRNGLEKVKKAVIDARRLRRAGMTWKDACERAITQHGLTIRWKTLYHHATKNRKR